MTTKQKQGRHDISFFLQIKLDEANSNVLEEIRKLNNNSSELVSELSMAT